MVIHCGIINGIKMKILLKVGNLVILLNIQGMSILVYLCVNVQILRHNGIMQINSILSATPYMEIRFAEVVLNLAESACGIGKKDDAVELLKDIRERVGYTGDCGLAVAELKADRDKLFSAILYERQIELAYEGKRFDDMRRWMLWNDDFGTCTRLGVEPLNGNVVMACS